MSYRMYADTAWAVTLDEFRNMFPGELDKLEDVLKKHDCDLEEYIYSLDDYDPGLFTEGSSEQNEIDEIAKGLHATFEAKYPGLSIKFDHIESDADTIASKFGPGEYYIAIYGMEDFTPSGRKLVDEFQESVTFETWVVGG